MLGRGIILTAVAVYIVVLGCIMWPTESPRGKTPEEGAALPAGTQAPPNLAGLPYRGVAMQIQRVDWVEQYKKNIDEIAAIGADTVLLVLDTRQENAKSCRIYLDMRMTLSPEKLGELIAHAKGHGLRVVLMPVVLLDNPAVSSNEWRGTISPDETHGGWNEWWDSYRSMINHFAWIAESNHANVLVVGSELVSTEDQLDQWTRTIQAVRRTFHGQLTYSSNWDHYTAVHFWDQLDLIGMNSYWKLGPDRNVSVEEIQKNWREIQHGRSGHDGVLDFVTKQHKPLLFLEVGWCSMANAASEPWDYTTSDPVDLELQRKLYEGFFRTWYGNPHLGGFMVWEWPPGDGGASDRGYTPENKPAEAVLREWLAKPRWEVK